MQIKNKYYPYPVIAAGNDSYEDSQFLTDANYEQNAHNIKFLFEAVLDDENNLGKSGLDGIVDGIFHQNLPVRTNI